MLNGIRFFASVSLLCLELLSEYSEINDEKIDEIKKNF